MIPQVAQKKLAQFVDVFCERGAFTPKEGACMFAAAVDTDWESVRTYVNSVRA